MGWTLLRPYVLPETLRAMQQDRHLQAILLLDAGDTLGWYRLMRDVAAFGQQIRLSRTWFNSLKNGGPS